MRNKFYNASTEYSSQKVGKLPLQWTSPWDRHLSNVDTFLGPQDQLLLLGLEPVCFRGDWLPCVLSILDILITVIMYL